MGNVSEFKYSTKGKSQAAQNGKPTGLGLNIVASYPNVWTGGDIITNAD